MLCHYVPQMFLQILCTQKDCHSMKIITLPSVCLDMYVTEHVDAVHNNVSETGVTSRVAVDVLWAVCFGLWHYTPPARAGQPTDHGELTSSTDSQWGMHMWCVWQEGSSKFRFQRKLTYFASQSQIWEFIFTNIHCFLSKFASGWNNLCIMSIYNRDLNSSSESIILLYYYC